MQLWAHDEEDEPRWEDEDIEYFEEWIAVRQ